MDLNDVDIRVIDQRIGMGIGGMDLVIRSYHVPTGVLVEVPTALYSGSYQARQAALEMLEYGLSTTKEPRA